MFSSFIVYRAVAADPAFATVRFAVHTRWIETEWAGGIPPYDGDRGDAGEPAARERITVEVGGRRFDVTVPEGLGGGTASQRGQKSGRPSRRGRSAAATAAATDALTAPMQGTIVKLAVAEGDSVAAGDLVVVLEAMKMEQPITAPSDGTIADLAAEVGATIQAGAQICRIVDAAG